MKQERAIDKYLIESKSLKATKIVLFIFYILTLVAVVVSFVLTLLRMLNYDAAWTDVGKIILIISPAILALYLLVMLIMLYKAIFVIVTKSAVKTYTSSYSIKGMFIAFVFVTLIAIVPKVLMMLNLNIEQVKLPEFTNDDFIQMILIGATVGVTIISAIVAAIASSQSLKIINNVEKKYYGKPSVANKLTTNKHSSVNSKKVKK